MNAALQAVTEYFEANKFAWQSDAEGSYVESQFCSEQGQWRCVLLPFEDPDRLMVLSLLPLKVPGIRRRATAEFLMRVNYRLITGSFDLDFNDGELRYRDCLLIDNGQPTTEQLDQVVGNSFRTFTHHLPVVASVAFGRISPVRAMKVMEKSMQEKTAQAKPKSRFEFN